MSEALGNIADVLEWDVFVMGVAFLVGASISVLLVLRPLRRLLEPALARQTKSRLEVLLEDLGKPLTTIAVVVTIYCTGAIANTFCDMWIDEHALHLCLRRIVAAGVPADDVIKTQVFETVYPDRLAPSPSEILLLYYHAKNTLWQDQDWREFLLYSQRMINVARVWAFASFLMAAAATVHLVLAALKVDWRSAREFLLSLGALVLALASYWLGMRVWEENEREFDSKVFGIYRTLHGAPPRGLAFIEEETYRLVRHEELPLFEPSGIVWHDGRLLVVNDKEDELCVFSADTGLFEQVVPLPPGAEGRSKFEAIARGGPHLYVIGAHFGTYRRSLRFELEHTKQGLQATDVTPLDLVAAIAEGLKGVQDRASVEGLAVTTDAEETLLLIGLRTTAARTAQEGFRVLRVRLQGTTGVLDGLLEFPHAPRTTSPGGLGYHLSDVFLQGSGRIFVLATSEDEAGAFHGNRIFCFDVGSGLQLWSTGPFATDQKAEGLTFWEAPPGLERAAIAFDNDFQDTGLAGSILIGCVPGALDAVGLPGFVRGAAPALEERDRREQR